ncbi:MAG TPA: undecaprenyl-diphosphate phosphatase [Burkholderiales bacterium]|nr:undecaprenyl-diphosphate phosphatase [Burkholderiales bacterium]
MDAALYLKALVLGVVEGLTEFLPISSTGHLIIAGQLLGFVGEKAKVFEIVIQSGAMLAVLWEYRERFAGALTGLRREPAARRFAANLLVAFLPAALLGLAFGGWIKQELFHAVPVAAAFIAGGLVILWVERRPRAARVESVDDMTWRDALMVGLAQSAALVPGVSRAGATIIGGMLLGLSRRAATEFSFFLAVPTLIAAGGYDFYRHRALFEAADLGVLAVGFGVSFAAAFLCVRWLLRYIATHDFRPFAWYRIAFGLLVLATASAGLVEWSP